MLESFGDASLVTSAIFPHTNQAVENCQPGRDGGSDRHGDEAGGVPWGVPGLEEERPDEISCFDRDSKSAQIAFSRGTGGAKIEGGVLVRYH